MDDEDEDDEEGMDELIQNPEFLHSVLSSLPGVNPEEALQNLEQMKDQQQQKDKKVTSWISQTCTSVCSSSVLSMILLWGYILDFYMHFDMFRHPRWHLQ